MITLTKEEAQQVLECLSLVGVNHVLYSELDETEKVIETLRARLSAPEPEKMADKYLMEIECTKCGAKQDGILTVNAPPQRKEWQSLTDERRLELLPKVHLKDEDPMTQIWLTRKEALAYAATIEADLREKNSA